MKESIDRSELRRMQREQERERRRIRDRQRRQSMTVEQRERHLARRRRNYQLRRLRAENAMVENNNNNNQISNELPHEDEEEEAAVSDVQQQQVTQLETLECLDDKAGSNLSNKRLRLSHVRRLARSGSKMVGEEMTKCGDASSTPCIRIGVFESGRLPNGLRLNRVKRLARAINTSSSEQASVNGYQVTDNNTVEQNQSLKNCRAISNENFDSDKLSLSETKLKDLTWTDNHQSWANVES